MENQVEFHLKAGDSEDIIKPLSEFFAPIAPTTIHQPEYYVKSIEPISIVLSIAGTMGIAGWAAQRYLLDPLADKVEEWWNGVSFLWKKSKTNRGIGLRVSFHFPTDTFEVIMDETNNPESLKTVWKNVEQACEIYTHVRGKGVQIDQIRFIPDGTNDMLVIAYTDNRPQYIVDLHNQSLRQIKTEVETDPSADIFMVRTLARRSEYLKMVAERGYEVSTEEIDSIEREIELRKAKLRQ